MSSSKETDAFLREARSWDEPLDERGVELRELVDRRIAAAAASATSATKSASASSFGLRVAGGVGLACVAFVVVALRGSTPTAPAVSGVSPSSPAGQTAPLAVEQAAQAVQPPELQINQPEMPTDVRDLPDAPRAASSGAAFKKADAVDGSLEIEAKILREARAARLAGQAARSLSLVTEHATRFPNGALAPERDAERISALCALGRREQAQKHIADFELRWTSSPLLERVRASCRGTP